MPLALTLPAKMLVSFSAREVSSGPAEHGYAGADGVLAGVAEAEDTLRRIW